MIEARFHDQLADIAAADWDALAADANPFTTHALLAGMEATGCIQPRWGWQPHHLTLHENGRLVAAAPLYLKTNSHGEFTFDWSWVDAWERAGGRYYPKLLCGVPYSPVTGPRLLARGDARLQRALVAAMRAEAERLQLSSVHANFLTADEAAAFDADWLARGDVQFQWRNRGWASFDAFLAALNHKKRKNLLHDRADVAASGLRIEWRAGRTLSRDEWRAVHALYLRTFAEKGNRATLTPAFFAHLGTLGDTAQLALARDGDGIAAMALFLAGGNVLYGRYWGSRVEVPGLHFELCYYQGIDHTITRGLQRFEPGAQGEHKLARGFLPVRTHSRHLILHAGFRAAVREALRDEASAVDRYADECLAHS
ncbi:MAG TPA: peptidogalycan biosysnthesis protein, partial [Rhodanobacter sp.]|nr:peptidogalycan biosysnthesis protein [Rhodanobacter sp.]